MTSEQTRTYWAGHFEAWQKSNLAQPKYCEQHNLKPPTFNYWRTRLRDQPSDPKLIPVNISQPRALIGIALPSGIRLEVPVSALAEALPIVCRTTQEAN